jgi:hypothetical protein
VEGAQKFKLSWSGFSDDLSGLMAFRLVGRAGSPPGCGEEAYILIQDTLATEFTTGLLDLGKTYYYRVCAMDNVENYENGAAASKKVLTENEPPTDGSVVINKGNEYTKTAAVGLDLFATDATQMCVSNSNTCTSWVSYATTKTWTLSAGSGLKTVKVWFRDSLGNVSEPASATIYLDVAKPVDGKLSIAMGEYDLTFDLSWGDANDGGGSGVKEYWLVYGTAGYPACTAADPARIYTGLDTMRTHEGLTFGKTYYYRVCAVDWVGNISTGAKASKKMQ